MRTAFRSLIAFVAFQAMVVGAQTPAQARATVLSGYEPGTIVVKTSERKLYLVLENGETITYPVGVGKVGRTWTGVSYINGKFIRPAFGLLPRMSSVKSRAYPRLFRAAALKTPWEPRR